LDQIDVERQRIHDARHAADNTAQFNHADLITELVKALNAGGAQAENPPTTPIAVGGNEAANRLV